MTEYEQVKQEILALMVCNEEPICHLVNSGEPCNIDCLHDKFADQILSHPRIAVLAEEQTYVSSPEEASTFQNMCDLGWRKTLIEGERKG